MTRPPITIEQAPLCTDCVHCICDWADSDLSLCALFRANNISDRKMFCDIARSYNYY